MIGACLITDGLAALRDPAPHAEVAAPITAQLAKLSSLPDNPVACVRAAGGTLTAAGALVAVGLAPRLAGALAAAVLAPVTALGYQFWTVKQDPERRAQVRAGFLSHLALLGGALAIAGTRKAAKSSSGHRVRTAR
jgi:uncharacterized membrane protein YphA (DoxX/SURF4 family)